MNRHFRNLTTRFTLQDDTPGGTPLELPRRKMAMPAITVAAIFAVFASVLVVQISKLNLQAMDSVFDLMAMLFELFWILGWSAGVLALGALTVVLVFFGESARLAGSRLIYVLNVGPFKIITEYELARMRNLSVEAGPNGESARVRFDYDEIRRGLGDTMPLGTAERNLEILNSAMAGVALAPSDEFAPPPGFTPPQFDPPAELTQRPLPLLSMLVLVVANLIPLVSVLMGGWKLEEVMVLFWAESAVIGFYTLLKIAVVARWWAPFPGLFFAGHFGGFMAIHFLFIYELFVRGAGAVSPGPGAFEALGHLFTPLWLAFLALFLSHGVSFVMNFLGHREYGNTTVSSLMQAPYRRIVVMQLTLIFGGWVVMLLKDPMPALVLLIVIKVVTDLRGHYGERASSTRK